MQQLSLIKLNMSSHWSNAMSPYNEYVVTVLHLELHSCACHVPYGYCGAIVWSDSAIIVSLEHTQQILTVTKSPHAMFSAMLSAEIKPQSSVRTWSSVFFSD